MRHLELVEGCSYGKFASLARRKEWSAEYLAETFRGKLEARDEPLPHYFRRVLACDPSPEVVIPYGSVIEKFLTAVEELARDQKLALCRCGCGSYPGAGRRLAWDSCREPTSEAQIRARKAAAGRLNGGLRDSTGKPCEPRKNVHLARTSKAPSAAGPPR